MIHFLVSSSFRSDEVVLCELACPYLTQ